MATYSKAAQKNVESAMKRMEKGTLKSGKSDKKVTNPKQAIAIGLSEAREKGATVPKKKAASKKAAPKKKTSPPSTNTAKKKAAKKAVSKKAGTAKSAADIKAAPRKKSTVPKTKRKKDSLAMMPVNPAALNAIVPPVEEKSPEIPPVFETQEDPVMATDKRALAKAVTRQDFKHHIQLSRGKQPVKSFPRKIMWR